MTMLIYPQLGTGALSQFPVRKRRRLRTLVNRAADGSSIKLADPAAEITEWQLEYTELSDDELAALQQFFTAAEGTLNGFTFLDPTGNLLAWSDKLDDAVWQRAPLLSVTGGVTDPTSGTKAWHVSNTGGAPQTILQSLAAPAGYLYCFSAYVRATQVSNATMLAGNQRADRAVTTQWARITFTSSGDPTAESITFGLELPAAASLDVYGIQVEPQAGASVYQAATSGGVYEESRLGDDILTVITTGLNRHSCTVRVIHANHL
jgi:hypothetical protein